MSFAYFIFCCVQIKTDNDNNNKHRYGNYNTYNYNTHDTICVTQSNGISSVRQWLRPEDRTASIIKTMRTRETSLHRSQLTVCRNETSWIIRSRHVLRVRDTRRNDDDDDDDNNSHPPRTFSRRGN